MTYPWINRLRLWWQDRFGRRDRPLRAPDVGPRAPAATSPDPAASPADRATSVARRVTVVIPALNEAERIASVVRHAREDPCTAEVIVVDDCSVDDTAMLATAAGARVVRSTMLGKGASMADGVREARHDCIVFLDGDLTGLAPGLVSRLAAPLLEDRADFVKARFGRSGGRVTELTARPMLRVFFPELAGFAQPLGGLIAARRDLLSTFRFEDGYGVDVGLLIDASRAGSRLVEVDIGGLEHDPQSLHALAGMAVEVSQVIYDRARTAGRLHVEQIGRMFDEQRQAAGGLEAALVRRKGRQSVLLVDLDGTLLPERFMFHAARDLGRWDALRAVMDDADLARDPLARARAEAATLRFVHQADIERIARAVPLREGMVDLVHRMRRAGFMVGVVSHEGFVAAEIIRRRVFADFALANTLVFEGGVCSGEIRPNAAFFAPGLMGTMDKGHGVNRLREAVAEQDGATTLQVWALGDGRDDLAMLRLADRGFLLGEEDLGQPLPPHIQRLDRLEALRPELAPVA